MFALTSQGFLQSWQGSISGYYLDQQAERAHLQEIHGAGIGTLSGNKMFKFFQESYQVGIPLKTHHRSSYSFRPGFV
jgi:DNA-binding IscR family transcriptional regulator